MLTIVVGLLFGACNVASWLAIELAARRMAERISLARAAREALRDRPTLAWMALWTAGGFAVFRLADWFDAKVSAGLGFAAAFYACAWLISWWRDKGRRVLAERLAGFKHRARLARMGVAVASMVRDTLAGVVADEAGVSA